MIGGSRNLRSSSLLSGSGLGNEGDADPLASMANLMDVMLVFACGLLLALVTYWGVDLSATGDEASTGLEQLEGSLSETGQSVEAVDTEQYEQLGMAYRDKETGEMYVVSPDGVTGAGDADGGLTK